MKTLPCENTLINILKLVNPKELEICLNGIFSTVLKTKEKQICIDGKTICSTTRKNREKVHIITALIAETGITLGQLSVKDKGNEIPAVQELLDEINIKGVVVTADAMHCQKKTVDKIIKNKGDYVLQLKLNQGNFYKDVEGMFEESYMDEREIEGNYETYETMEKGHGRIERKSCYVMPDVEYFTDYIAEWKGLKKIFCVKREVIKGEEKTVEKSYYISIKNVTAMELLGYTRRHWQIESFHWMLDVNFGEDDNQIINKIAQENLNIMRKVAIKIHKEYVSNHETKRKTIISSIRKSLFNINYLEEILQYYCDYLVTQTH